MARTESFKFQLRTTVNIPGYAGERGLIVARGEDMDHGRYYTIAWIDQRGRPATTGGWEHEMVKANPPPKVRKRKTVSKKKQR